MENLKILFLDIDGVLNSARYDALRLPDQGNIDETRLPLLQRIIGETQAKIVLSSSWRKQWDKNDALCGENGAAINRLFRAHGLSVYDKIPDFPSNDRAEEIRAWLKQNASVTRFVILDDIRFGWGDLQDFVVNTNSRIGRGLEERHAEQAIRLLNG
ncbi:MAG: hypothetical protein IJD59_05085 [Clostridia bacterium]|nr:hypothetical protein [Clostridia bacterium]